ncbi:hypothetical protein [Subdoligranulum variabile]|uniref:hypothetical protein n=1 Tax=Subdoligranulum variabile TaxID=214851 RepID=UPI0029435B10|nr:hypothetical protein [Subdoligranulum variabile]
MHKVLLILGIVFTILGLVIAALATTLVLMLREPLLGLVAVPGIIFFVLGLAFLAAVSRRRRDRAWLAENGRTIQADIVGVQYDTRVRVNGRCPLVLQCQAVNPADGKVYVFESDSLWFDPTPFLDGQTTMPVLVDPDDYHRYQMLTEGILPEKG